MCFPLSSWLRQCLCLAIRRSVECSLEASPTYGDGSSWDPENPGCPPARLLDVLYFCMVTLTAVRLDGSPWQWMARERRVEGQD